MIEKLRGSLPAKPAYNLAEDHPLAEIYKKIDIDSQVSVSERWASEKTSNPLKGHEGRVIGFSTGIQGLFNVDYLIVNFVEANGNVRQSWLYTLDLIDQKPA